MAIQAQAIGVLQPLATQDQRPTWHQLVNVVAIADSQLHRNLPKPWSVSFLALLAGALRRFGAQPWAAASQWDLFSSHTTHTQDQLTVDRIQISYQPPINQQSTTN
jgi:hypothetical protein